MVISALTAVAANGGSAILGGVLRFLGDNAKARDNRDKMQHEQVLALAKVNEKSRKAARDFASKPLSFTRRFVVIAIVTAVLTMMFVGGFTDSLINVPTVSNTNSFFGFEWGGNTSYEALKGFVIIPEVLLAMSTVVSFLFGSNVVKR